MGYFDGNPIPKAGEVDDWKWMDWKKFLEEIQIQSNPYSPWCIEEAKVLDQIGNAVFM